MKKKKMVTERGKRFEVDREGNKKKMELGKRKL